MRFLNNLSIKSRLLFVIFVPLSILMTTSMWKIDMLVNEISEFSSIEANLSAGKKVMEQVLIADNLRLNTLQQKANLNSVQLNGVGENSEQIRELTKSLLSSQQKKTKSKILQSFIVSLNDMDEALVAASDFDQTDIAEWSSWIIEDISFELFVALEKLAIHTGIAEVDQKLQVINQLRWIMFYELEENWFIQVMLQQESFAKLQQLRTVSTKEEMFIERFLSLNANEKQIELLLKTFQTESFLKSLQYKENILSRNLDFFSQQERNQVETVLKNRLASIMEMSQGIVSTTNKEIKENINTLEKNIYWLISAIVGLILLIIFLGFNLVNRIFTYLKSTIKKLEKIEVENDYSIQISEVGKDEFSHFSSKLNLLIAERKVNVGKMIQAKEDAEKANKAKSYFLANMSHEIRTPLNGILGMYQILSSTSLSHSQKNNLETINQSSRTLLMLINDILDISKIESGKLALSESRTDLREAIYETVAMISSKAVEKQLKLSVDIDSLLPTYLMIDEHRLRQILMNLLSNALKFTQAGLVELSVQAELKAERCQLTFKVKDSGIGIAKESQDAIFKPFVQEDGSITREFGGTGLGLAISAQLVELMGGGIQCDSEKGKGSTFYFAIDVAIATIKVQDEISEHTEKYKVGLIATDSNKAEILTMELKYLGIESVTTITRISELSAALSSTSILLYCQSDLSQTHNDIDLLVAHYPNNPLIVIQETDDQQFDFRDKIDGQIMIPFLGKRCLQVIKDAVANRVVVDVIDANQVAEVADNKRPVLVVEDNLVNQKVASFFLKSFGYEFEIVENGLIALNSIKDGNTYSAVLMDCMMPIMDGFTATQEIRFFEKENSLAKVPIIALTASIFDEDIKHCYASGMDDYIAKPIDKEVLENKLKEYVNNYVEV